MNGSQVYPAWRAGNIALIEEYCRHDVELTYAIFQRMRPYFL